MSHQATRADLSGAVAALTGQVLTVSQEARRSGALERQPGVDEGGGAAVVIHKERLNTQKTSHQPVTSSQGRDAKSARLWRLYLAGVVVLHLPAAGQLQLFVGKHVQEGHQVPVVLVALKVVSVPAYLADHVLQTRVGGEHTVGTLRPHHKRKTVNSTPPFIKYNIIHLGVGSEKRAYRVGMQHSEEVGAGEELGAGRLEQQSEARPGAGRSCITVPPQLWETKQHNHKPHQHKQWN